MKTRETIDVTMSFIMFVAYLGIFWGTLFSWIFIDSVIINLIVSGIACIIFGYIAYKNRYENRYEK